MTSSTDFLTKIRSLTTAEEQRACRGIYADFLDDQEKPLDAARQRVLASPTSDERREQFADALERDGQENWATFVRLQVKIAKGFLCRNPRYETIYDEFHGNSPVDKVFRGNCGFCNPCANAEQDRMHANAILLGQSTLMSGKVKDYERNWISWSFPALAGYCINSGTLPFVPNMGVLFHRGLISEVHCPWDGQYGWKDNGDAITDAHPVGKVTLSTIPRLVVNYSPENKMYCGRFDGCRRRELVSRESWEQARDHDILEEVVRKRLLNKEWPGIEFVLPRE